MSRSEVAAMCGAAAPSDGANAPIANAATSAATAIRLPFAIQVRKKCFGIRLVLDRSTNGG
jgi:hypothetical protein